MFKFANRNLLRNNTMLSALSKKLFTQQIKTVGVLGSGQMGTGIAYVFGR